MRYVRCAACAADETLAYSKTVDRISGEVFNVVRCAQCGLVYVNPQPETTQLARYYPLSHQQAAPAAYERMDAVPRAKFAQKLLHGRPGRVLDVGCGKGLLLLRLRDAGWDVHGTELSEISSRYARGQGLPVHQVAVEQAGFEPQSFDLVTMFHVLEHLTDPRHTLEHLWALLRPGGFLVVEVPNIGSWYARFFGDHWFHYDVPRHVYHFNRSTLERMLNASGFDLVSMTTRNVQYDAFGAVQSALNMILRRPNLLNDFNTRELRFAEIFHGATPVRGLCALAASQIALLVGFPVLALTSVLGSPWVDGGTLRYVARRPSSNAGPDPA
jgi:2-polyprenyl-3-methyl-5-hydroxy-6-metoxy-1,4-benzoquinol methylase